MTTAGPSTTSPHLALTDARLDDLLLLPLLALPLHTRLGAMELQVTMGSKDQAESKVMAGERC